MAAVSWHFPVRGEGESHVGSHKKHEQASYSTTRAGGAAFAAGGASPAPTKSKAHRPGGRVTRKIRQNFAKGARLCATRENYRTSR